MSVSDKDREAAARIRIGALNAVILGVDWAGLIAPPTGAKAFLSVHEVARQALDALIAHGWGPRPTVDPQRLNDLVTACTLEITLNPLTNYLESRGIEVSDD
jgi:hypothetical protein